MTYRLKSACFVMAAFLFCAPPLSAQLEIGDNLKLSLSGDVGTDYAGSFGNVSASEHSLGIGGNGNLTGFYYNPNFLSFGFHPFYNRSQDNSTFQSIGDSSGFDASVNIFSGSHFPGYINFGRSYNSTGQFGIPESSPLLSHGDGQTFGIGWSAFVPNLPSLSASFSTYSGSSSIFGTEQTDHSSNRLFTVRSDYLWRGFRLMGSFIHLSNDSSLPLLLDGLQQESSGSSNTFSVSASHPFPLHGGFSVAFSRSSFGYGSGGTENSGSADTISAGVNIHPASRLSANFTTTYTDNLSESIAQQIITAGGPAPQFNLGQSRSFYLSGNATLSIIPNLVIYGGVNHQDQFFEGQSFASTQLNAGAAYNYTRPFLGMLSFSLGVIDNATDQGNTGTGINAQVSFYRKIHRYEVSANFAYAQYVQTLLAIATTSSFGYSASVSRKINDHTFWAGSFGAGHSGFNTNGSTNHSERVSTSLTYRRISTNLFYSQSAGLSLLTANGLVVTPVGLPPGVLPPAATVLFNTRSVGAGLSATMLKRMTLTAAYSQASGQTISPTLASTNHIRFYNAFLRYPFRKMYFFGGYTRLQQDISTAGLPTVINSYSFGISRWFNVF